MPTESENRRDMLAGQIQQLTDDGKASADAILISKTIELAALHLGEVIDHAAERIFYMLDQKG